MSTSTESKEPVSFIVDGREVSNDRRWYAQNLRKQREDQVREQVKASQTNPEDSTSTKGYADMTAAELKSLAEEREIDLTGVKKKSQLIGLLEQHDEDNRDTELTGQEVTDEGVEPTEEDDDSEDDEEA